MPRCGCSGTCTCRIQEGPGIKIVGNGSAAQPYIVSAEEGMDNIQVVAGAGWAGEGDGAGTALDPFVITGEAVPDPDPDNLLTVTSSGISVRRQTVETVFAGQDPRVVEGTGIDVSGVGSIADPYVITNTAPGGGAGGGAAPTVIQEGTGIDVAGNGSGGNPFIITNTAPDIPPIEGPGIVIGSGTGESRQISVDTSGAWPTRPVEGQGTFHQPNGHAGPATSGSAIYTDPNGEVRGVPDHTTLGGSAEDGSGDVVYFAGQAPLLCRTTLIIDNPSPSRTMLVSFEFSFLSRLEAPGTGLRDFDLIYQLRRRQSEAFLEIPRNERFTWNVNDMHTYTYSTTYTQVVPPGASTEADIRQILRLNSGNLRSSSSSVRIVATGWTF